MSGVLPVHLVVFLTRSNSLGTWERAGMLERELAIYHALRPRLAGVSLVSYGRGRGEARRAAALGDLELRWNRLGLPLRLYAAYLRRLLPLPRAAIVKSNQVQGAEIALAAARRAGVPFVARCGYLYSHFMARAHGQHSPQARAARALEQRVFTAAERVVVTTAEMAETVRRRYRLAPDKLRVIPNYVDTERFAPDPAVRPHPRRVLFVGRLAEQKNPLALVEAAAGLEVELVMVGEGPLEEAVRHEARRLGVKLTLRPRLPQAELPGLMRSSACLVLPSRYEGHPKVLLEAMAAGRPVVAARVEGIASLVEHGRTGWLCEPAAADIRRAVSEVLEDPARAEDVGRAARRMVEERFSLPRVAEQELALYRELAA